MVKKIVLVDGHSLLFRMFYGIPNSIKNSKGKEIKGLIGFIGSIKKIFEEFTPYSILVIFDSETSRYSNEQMDSDYKSNRIDYSNVDSNKNPFSQLPMIKNALDYLEIFNIEIELNETDDFIASIVNNDNFKKYEFIISSWDTDFIQLINKNVKMHIQKGKNSILFDEGEIIKRFGVTPKQYIEYKALIGDSSDNIKGIKRIGKVTASKILQNDNIVSFIKNSQNSKLVELLKNNLKQINKNIKLITLNQFLDISKVSIKKVDTKKMSVKVRQIISDINED